MREERLRRRRERDRREKEKLMKKDKACKPLSSPSHFGNGTFVY